MKKHIRSFKYFEQCTYIYLYLYIYIYIYICITQSFLTGTKVIGRKHIVQPTGFGACSSTCCQWDGEDVPAPWEWSNSHPPVRVQKSCVNQFIWYNICRRGVFVSNSKLRNCVVVAIECFFATIDRCSGGELSESLWSWQMSASNDDYPATVWTPPPPDQLGATRLLSCFFCDDGNLKTVISQVCVQKRGPL